jgi:hypothetical protein
VVTKLAADVEYIVFVVAAPFVMDATEFGVTAYVKFPKLFEVGSINENVLLVKLYTPLFGPNVIVEILG